MDWKKELKEILKEIDMSEDYIEETIGNLEELAEKPRIKGSGSMGFGK
jgi:hypothetical protein